MLKDKYINPLAFSKQEFEQYEDSLKYYKDLTNVTNTAYLEGEKKE